MKKIITFVFIIMLMLCTAVVALANDEEIKKELDNVNAQIEFAEGEKKLLEEQKKERAKQITQINQGLKDLEVKVMELEAQKTQVEMELAIAQGESQQAFDNFSQRLMAMYEQGSNAYIAMILDAQSLSDLKKRLDLIKEISGSDRDVYDFYKNNENTIFEKQEELNRIQSEYDAQYNEFNTQISANSADIEMLFEAIKVKKEELKTLEAERKRLSSKLSSREYADKLFAEAEKYMGMPYVFGGSTPTTSFDCSGFVCYATTKSGVYNLPRTTAQGIYNKCIKISPSEAKRGDIIFFQGTYDAGEVVTHVGFYAGDGKMLHCGNPIQYASTQSSYWSSHFYAFGRLDI